MNNTIMLSFGFFENKKFLIRTYDALKELLQTYDALKELLPQAEFYICLGNYMTAAKAPLIDADGNPISVEDIIVKLAEMLEKLNKREYTVSLQAAIRLGSGHLLTVPFYDGIFEHGTFAFTKNDELAPCYVMEKVDVEN